jgi:putative DNA primase/helicase
VDFRDNLTLGAFLVLSDAKPIRISPHTDAGNAEIFASLYRGKVLFDHLRGKWLIWTGIRWRPDDDGEIRRLARAVSRRRRELAEDIEDANNRTKEFSFSFQSENVGKIKAMLEEASFDRLLTDNGKNWDTDPMILGCENGIIDLRTGKMITPKPTMRISKSTGVRFESSATCPKWIATLKAMWPERPEIVSYVQRILGYSITGSTKEQALFCFYGEGQNGKSTMLGAIVHALGDYGYTMPFSTIEFVNRSSVSNDVASLHGRRFVMSSETQEDIQLNEGRIKSLTGDSTITARYLHQEYFTFTPVSKFHLAFNHKPKVHDDSHGFWRRLKLIRIDGIFDGAKEVKGFEAELATEASGILNWLVAGCLDWQQNGLCTPDAVTDATTEYRLESNPLRLFIEERCVEGAGLRVISADLWRTYQNWFRGNGEKYGLTRNGFARRLTALGFIHQVVKVDGVATRVWDGLRLSEDDDGQVVENEEKAAVH